MKKLKDKWTTRATNGVVSKGIYVDGSGVEYIIKGNGESTDREPLSECLGSKVFALFIPTVNYEVEVAGDYKEIKVHSYPYVSVCRKLKESLYPLARQVDSELGYRDCSQSDILKFLKSKELDTEHLMRVLLLDAFIGNQDRHWNNFDLMVKEGKVMWAPALDFGASLLYNVIEGRLKLYSGNQIGPDSSKPFSGVHRDNIKKAFKLLNVQNKKLLKNVKLSEILIAVYDAYTKLPEGACSEKRIESTISYLRQRYPVYIEPYIDK